METGKSGLRRAALLLSLIAAGCGVTDATVGIDDPSSSVDAKITSSTSSTCVAPQLRPTYALGGTIIVPWGQINGYVLIKDETIVGLASSRDAVPSGIPVVDTGG